MKNYLSILLTAVLLISMLALSGCNSNVTADVEYVKDQGKLVVGVIDAPPLTELNDEGVPYPTNEEIYTNLHRTPRKCEAWASIFVEMFARTSLCLIKPRADFFERFSAMPPR